MVEGQNAFSAGEPNALLISASCQTLDILFANVARPLQRTNCDLVLLSINHPEPVTADHPGFGLRDRRWGWLLDGNRGRGTASENSDARSIGGLDRLLLHASVAALIACRKAQS
jgi:hypothetical protein